MAWVLFFVLCVKLLLPFFTFARGRGCGFFHFKNIILYILNKYFGTFVFFFF